MSHSQLPVLFCFFIFGYKEYNQPDFGTDHLVTSMCRVVSCVAGIACLLWPACSFGKTVSLCRASFCILRTNLPVIPGISCLPTFDSNPMMKRTSFLGVSSRRSCRSSENCSTSASLALWFEAQIWITVILNGLPWKQTEIILLFSRLHPSIAFGTLVDYEGYSISSKGFLPTVIDIMVI